MEKKQAVFWEGYKRDGGCFEPLDVPCSIRSLASTNVSYFHFPYTENHYMLDWSLGILHVKYAVIIMQVVLGIPSTQSSRLQWNISLSFVTNAGLTRASASWHTGPNFSSHHQLVHSRVFTCSNEKFNTDVDSLTFLFFCKSRFSNFQYLVLLPCEWVMPLNHSRCFTYRVFHLMRKGPVHPAWLPVCLWPQRSCNQEPGHIGWVQIPDLQGRAGMWTQMWTFPPMLPATPPREGMQIWKRWEGSKIFSNKGTHSALQPSDLE